MWIMKFQADMKNKDLWDAFKPGFEKKIPIKEDDVNVRTDKGKEHAKLVNSLTAKSVPAGTKHTACQFQPEPKTIAL